MLHLHGYLAQYLGLICPSKRIYWSGSTHSPLTCISILVRADVLDKEKRKMPTSLLLNCGFDQAIVLATSEEAAHSIMPQESIS